MSPYGRSREASDHGYSSTVQAEKPRECRGASRGASGVATLASELHRIRGTAA